MLCPEVTADISRGVCTDFDMIAKYADALDLAKEESALALLGSTPPAGGSRGGFGRRLASRALEAERLAAPTTIYRSHLPAASEQLLAFAEQLLRPAHGAAEEDPVYTAIHEYRRRTQSSSTAAAISQDPQSVSLAIALLAVKARPGVANLFDDAGIAQLCQFRKGLMDDEPTWVDYCLKVDDPSHVPVPGEETPQICSKGSDVRVAQTPRETVTFVSRLASCGRHSL